MIPHPGEICERARPLGLPWRPVLCSHPFLSPIFSFLVIISPAIYFLNGYKIFLFSQCFNDSFSKIHMSFLCSIKGRTLITSRLWLRLNWKLYTNIELWQKMIRNFLRRLRFSSLHFLFFHSRLSLFIYLFTYCLGFLSFFV